MYKKVKFVNLLLINLITFVSASVFALNVNDNGQISATPISRIVHVQSEADIQKAIQTANAEHLPIAMMGKQHSQGGQTLAANAIELYMSPFNKVLALDIPKKQITVQSGITWGDLQKYINQYNLAVTSMQSPNIFTVGGSISVNAHGDDFRAGAVGNSIIGFHLLLADGKKVYVTPTTNPKLWSAVIGGYGLFGVITDVTLQLTDNNFLMSHYKKVSVADFPKYFQEKIWNDKKVVLFYAHVNIVPNANLLQDMYVITYTDTNQLPKKIVRLDNPEKWNILLRPTFNLSRYSKIGKAWRWRMEQTVFSRHYNNKVVTRNNAMEKAVRFASDRYSRFNADWLQEYFIPIERLPEFLKTLRVVVFKNRINLLNVTIRYVPAETNFLLPYALGNRFAVVLYFNQDLSSDKLANAKMWTRELIQAALSLNGNYYLTYQNFASDAQFQQAYPGYKQFIEYKKLYDPNNIFKNKFYEAYFMPKDKK